MDVSTLLFDLAPYTPFLAFGLLMLAGLNLPISEELVIIVAASIASTIVPENRVVIYIGCWLGAYVSDIMVYTVGRFAGRRLLNTRFGAKILSPKKIEKMSGYFSCFGILTLLFGRLVPFGFRNVLFTTAGIAKMPFARFAVGDVIPLTITTSTYFTLGFILAEQYERIFPYLNRVKYFIFALFLIFVTTVVMIKALRKKKGIQRLDKCPEEG